MARRTSCDKTNVFLRMYEHTKCEIFSFCKSIIKTTIQQNHDTKGKFSSYRLVDTLQDSEIMTNNLAFYCSFDAVYAKGIGLIGCTGLPKSPESQDTQKRGSEQASFGHCQGPTTINLIGFCRKLLRNPYWVLWCCRFKDFWFSKQQFAFKTISM